MSVLNGEAASSKQKAMVVLAGVGVFWLSWGVLSFLYVLLPLHPLDFLWVQTAEVSLLSPRAFFSYLAVLLAAVFVGWWLPGKGWLHGAATGVCTQLPAIGPSFITISRLSLDLLRSPDMVFAGPGTPPLGVMRLWLVTVLMPLVVGLALGAVGGLSGRWLHQRVRAQSQPDLPTPAQRDRST